MHAVLTTSSLACRSAFQGLLASLLGLFFAASGALDAQAQDPPIVPTAKTPRPPGKAFWVKVKVGSENAPVKNLFGVSFTLEYDASRLSVTEDEAGAFLGGDVVYTANNDASAGEIGIGVSRKSGVGGVDGIGIVARVKLKVGSGVSNGTELDFALSEIDANDPNGNEIALSPQDFTVKVSSVPPIEPEVSSPQTPGKEFWVDVKVGSNAYSVQNLFGVSFTIEYEKAHVSVVDDQAGAFLGGDVVYTSNVDEAAGEIGIGISRKSGAGGVGGGGVVARVKFRAGGGAPEGTSLTFALNEIDADDPGGSAIELRPGEEKAVLKTPAAARLATVSGNGPVGFGDTGVTIDFSGTGGSGTVSVRKYGEGPSEPVNISEENKSNYRFVVEAGPGLSVGPGTEVRFDTGSLEGLSAPEKVSVYKRPETGSGAFKQLESSYDPGAGELVVPTGSFSEFAFGSNADPLPVELTGFQARATGSSAVLLTWQTASETSNAGFEVQHQLPTSDTWNVLGFVESKVSSGTTTEPKTYQFTAEDLAVGAHRFRLRQIDVDGSSTFTDPVSVGLAMQEALQLTAPSPNPVSKTATLSFAVKKEARARVTVYNMLGQRVRTLYEGTPVGGESRHLHFGIGNLPSGLYIVRLKALGRTKSRRVAVVQ